MKTKTAWMIRTHTVPQGLVSEHVVTEPEPSLALDTALAEADSEGLDLTEVTSISMEKVKVIG